MANRALASRIRNRFFVAPLTAALVALAWLALSAAPSAAAPPSSTAEDAATPATPESVGMSSERLERLTANLRGYVEREEIAGVVALIARRGQVVYHESIGLRDVAGQAPIQTDTIFRIASMTKPIASVALMMLYEEGHFQLRDPISKFLPEFSDMKVAVPPDPEEYVGRPYKLVEAVRPITFQHVLTHTAGFPNTYRGLTQGLYAELYEKRTPDWVVGDFVEELAKLPLEFQPGDRWEYGPATDVVGRLVEVISGRTLDEFLRERIFAPLGMTDTHFYLPEEKVGRFAALYRPDENGRITLTDAPTTESRWVQEPHKYFSGGGGLVSTTTDYFRFHQMMLEGGELDGVRILGPRTIRLMTANHIGDLGIWLRGPGSGFGLGYAVVTDLGQSAAPAAVGSYSWGGAFCTVFWVDPEDELVGVLMTQVRPYTHLNIRADFRSLTYQAIVD